MGTLSIMITRDSACPDVFPHVFGFHRLFDDEIFSFDNFQMRILFSVQNCSGLVAEQVCDAVAL